MVMIGFQGMVTSALFWGGGCVLGGVVAEKLFYWNNSLVSERIMGAESNLADVHEQGSLIHRLCVLLVCLVWPLIWVGGLVTTYDAGMLFQIGRGLTATICSCIPTRLGYWDRLIFSLNTGTDSWAGSRFGCNLSCCVCLFQGTTSLGGCSYVGPAFGCD